MATRVPKAELSADFRENMIKQVGEVSEPLEVTFNNPAVAISTQAFAASITGSTCSRSEASKLGFGSPPNPAARDSLASARRQAS
jgi:hypothetical protein